MKEQKEKTQDRKKWYSADHVYILTALFYSEHPTVQEGGKLNKTIEEKQKEKERANNSTERY